MVVKLADAPVRSLNSLRRFMAPSEIGDCALEEVAAVMIKPGNQALHQEFELPRRVARQPDTAAQGTGWFFPDSHPDQRIGSRALIVPAARLIPGPLHDLGRSWK